jgi:hypothetical protein
MNVVGTKCTRQTMLTIALIILCSDEYDSDGSITSEDENRPQTRAELMSKAMKSVVKRETAMKKQGFQYDLSDVQERSKKDKSKSKSIKA